MSLRTGGTAPDSSAQTTIGTIRFPDWIGNDLVFIFSHSADFTRLCSTEMGRTAQFADRAAVGQRERQDADEKSCGIGDTRHIKRLKHPVRARRCRYRSGYQRTLSGVRAGIQP